MLPSELKAEHFVSYPPQGRQVATNAIALLRQLPLSFVSLLLREMIVYDWKFPAERSELDRQLAYLVALSPERLHESMTGFMRLELSSDLEHVDWVNTPAQFSERLSAHLWATRQVDNFRVTADNYIQKFNTAMPEKQPPLLRMGMVVVGQGVREERPRLFRKLRPHGVYFTHLEPANGLRILLDTLAARAKAHPFPYGHWYVDGGQAEAVLGSGLTSISYASLWSVRGFLLKKMRASLEAGVGVEALHTTLAQTTPEELGLGGAADEAVLGRFQVNLLTEGSGTQLFSTTFVQWAAREILRRAQPATLLGRSAGRKAERAGV
jgi:hypothetical protein